ncbi:SDR family NAD(P)-dependent oxidoreductase [Citricoccus sp. GCM10030269]|uniref:SDR family NAD(P)-dependent oxidoreductase n=1 Tax=Citricoccus sp. GCM10030269 TaxID=3273388 RepID=UPI00360A9C1D
MARTVELKGAVVVVTGGASGIGRGMAEAFLAEGARVVLADIDEQALSRTAGELGALGVRTDVTDQSSVDDLADRTLAEYGRIHVVCNNAGVGPFGPLEGMTLEDWKFVLDINLWGVIHGIRSFVPRLKKNADWGHVVNTSSMSVHVTPAEAGAYVTSKAAVLGLTEVLSAELEQDESVVGTTALLPGFVRTNIKDSLRSRPATERTALHNVDLAASGREFSWLDPLDVGRMVVDAVRRNQLYLNTSVEVMPQVLARHEAIQSGVPSGPSSR